MKFPREESRAAGRMEFPLPFTGFQFLGAALPSGATFTRASTGYRMNSSGVLVSEAIDVPRFDYSPAGVLLGLLLEPARTNLALSSQDLSALSYGAINSGTGSAAPVVTADTDTAPDGTTTADRGVFNRGVADPSYSLLTQGAVTVVSSYYAASAYFRSRTTPATVNLYLAGSSSFAGANLAVPSASWLRGSVGVAATGVALSVALGQRIGVLGLVGDAATDLALWGVQIELCVAGERLESSTYIPTVAEPVTRSTDILTLAWGDLGVANGTILVRYTFDDHTTQDVSTVVAAGVSVVPTNLARARLLQAQRIA